MFNNVLYKQSYHVAPNNAIVDKHIAIDCVCASVECVRVCNATPSTLPSIPGRKVKQKSTGSTEQRRIITRSNNKQFSRDKRPSEWMYFRCQWTIDKITWMLPTSIVASEHIDTQIQAFEHTIEPKIYCTLQIHLSTLNDYAASASVVRRRGWFRESSDGEQNND